MLDLLESSAAFYTVGHDILMQRLHISFSVRGSALAWIDSFIDSRTQTNVFNVQQSTCSALDFPVPGRRVLGPILFLLYKADATAIVERH